MWQGGEACNLRASRQSLKGPAGEGAPCSACGPACSLDTVDATRSQGASSSGAAADGAEGADGESGTQPRLWAHPIPRPERGCLLVAHPLLFRSQQTYFYQVPLQRMHSRRAALPPLAGYKTWWTAVCCRCRQLEMCGSWVCQPDMSRQVRQ